MRKLGYFLPRALALFILSLIPGLNLIATPLWLLFGLRMTLVKDIDYPADNQKLGWSELLIRLQASAFRDQQCGVIPLTAISNWRGLTPPPLGQLV